MRFASLGLLVMVSATAAGSQVPLSFEDFFLDQAIRVDLHFVGDGKDEWITLDRLTQEPIWPESVSHLIDPFGYGRYAVELFDFGSNRLIYSRGFDLMFGEYKTTGPALAGTKRAFGRSVRVPWPRRPVRFVIKRLDSAHFAHPIFSQTIDPADYHIHKETPKAGDWTFDVMVNGHPHQKVDVVFVAEGYTVEDKATFEADVERAANWIFALEPYRSLKQRFNVRAVMRPSLERGMDEPRQGVYRRTTLNASFNAFDTDRYQLVEDGQLLREIAAEVPYDVIVVLTNSDRYGGGGIYNDYTISTVDNERSQNVLIHELGHSFAGLADEYYLSDVAYNDIYPQGIEPLEPNITRFLSPERLKWKDLLTPGIALPTDWGKEKVEAIQAELQRSSQAMREDVSRAKQRGASEAEIKQIEEKHKATRTQINQRLEAVRKQYQEVEDKVGLFEGAAYTAKGMYRPMMYCLMIYHPRNELCRVCQRAVRQMIEYYASE